MIDIDELMRIAKTKNITNKGYAEKDYLQEITLLSISRNTKDELIFKGGTCIYKLYNLDRFSEDLDFTAVKKINLNLLLKKIVSDLKAFGMDVEVQEIKNVFNSHLISLKIKGPLYKGTTQSSCKLQIDINTKSSVTSSNLVNFFSLYPNIPKFSILAMSEKEILTEKVRTIFARTRARDVYDLWFLLKKGILPDKNMIDEKLRYYNQKYNLAEFEKSINKAEKIWKKELNPIIPNVPEFKEVKDRIIEVFKINLSSLGEF